MRRTAFVGAVLVIAGTASPSLSAAATSSAELPRISALLVMTRAEKASAGISQPSLADSLLQLLQQAQDFAAKGDSTDASARLTRFTTTVQAQRGAHIFSPVADRLVGVATGTIPPTTTTVTPGVATTVSATVDGVPASLLIPSGTKVGIVEIDGPALPNQVTSPTGRLDLGDVTVHAYDKLGVPLTTFSSPLKLTLQVPTASGSAATTAEIDTLDPKTHDTQRLASQAATSGSSVTVTASTGHLSPFTVTAPSTSGVITNVAGGAGAGDAVELGQYESGLAAFGPTIYVADYDLGVIRAIDTTTGREKVFAGTTGSTGSLGSAAGDGGPATDAFLNYPEGLAVDALGDLFIADTGNSRIREVKTDGAIVTVAGKGEMGDSGSGGDGGPAVEAGLFNPGGVAVDGAGNVFISDTNNNAVREVDTSGTINTVPGLAGSPTGIVAAPDGTVYVAERTGDGVSGFTTSVVKKTSDGTVSTLMSGPGYDAYTSLALDGNGHLLVGSFSNDVVVSLDLASCATSCAVTPIAGTGVDGFSGDGHAATTARLSSPFGLAVDQDGATYISDSGNVRVRRVDYAGLITTFAGDGTSRQSGDGGQAPDAQLSWPQDVTADASGNEYIVDYFNHSVRKVNVAGVITTLAANLGYPVGITTDPAGNVFVSETFDDQPSKILKIKPDGAISTFFSGLPSPMGLAAEPGGSLLVTDLADSVVYRVRPGLPAAVVAGGGSLNATDSEGRAATDAQLDQPIDVVRDDAGDIFISDAQAHLVREVMPDGTITTVAGSTDLGTPYGLALGPAGQLYVADEAGSVVRMVVGGQVSTVVGTGVYGHSGDGGPATAALLTSPQGIATDSAGNLYVTDVDAGVVRRVAA